MIPQSQPRRRPRHSELKILVLLFIFLNSFLVVNGQHGLWVEVGLPGLGPMWSGGHPVFVQGMWHSVKVSGVDPDLGVELELDAGGGEYGKYVWAYNGTFREETHGGFYIKEDLCSASGDTLIFHVGLDWRTPLGNWTLTVRNGAVEEAFEVVVVQAEYHATVQKADVTLWQEPFTEGAIMAGMPAMTIRNNGNIFVRLEVHFSRWEENFLVNLDRDTLGPGDSASLRVGFRFPSWRPMRTVVTGRVDVIPVGFVESPGAFNVFTTQTFMFDVHLNVGHSGYELLDLDLFQVEYPPIVQLYLGKVRDVPVYLTGNCTVTVTVHGEGVSIVRTSIDGEEFNVSAQVRLEPGNMSTLLISVRPLAGVEEGKIRIHLVSEFEVRDVVIKTKLKKQPTGSPPEGGERPYGLAVILALLAAFALSLWWSKRRPKAGRGGQK